MIRQKQLIHGCNRTFIDGHTSSVREQQHSAAFEEVYGLMGEVSLGEKNHLSKRIEVDGYAEMIMMASRFNEMLAESREFDGSFAGEQDVFSTSRN